MQGFFGFAGSIKMQKIYKPPLPYPDLTKKYLKEWLQNPAEKDELRYETLLKLFFGNEGGAVQAMAHINAFQEKIEKELPYLTDAADTLKNYIDTDDTHKYYLLTVEFGIKTYRAYLEWCEEAKAILEKENK